MGRAVGGAAGAGCGAFTLVGVLVGVGLTVWLGSQVMGGVGGDDGPLSKANGLATTTTTTTIASPELKVAPDTAVADGATVVIQGDGFGPGPVELVMCVADVGCDPATAQPVTVDGAGGIATPFVATQVLTVDGTRHDCATPESSCVVAVRRRGDAPSEATAAIMMATSSPGG